MNLVEGFVGEAECALWIDGALFPLAEGRFDFDAARPLQPWKVKTADGGADLRFEPGGIHEEHKNFGVIASRFVQPVGSFSGTIAVEGRGPIELDQVLGVVEDQDRALVGGRRQGVGWWRSRALLGAGPRRESGNESGNGSGTGRPGICEGTPPRRFPVRGGGERVISRERMDPREMETLIQRLVANPHDEEALAYAHRAGTQDPRSYAILLEKVGGATTDPAYAAHWLSEAANVWSTTIGDAHHAARTLMGAIEKDPTQRTAAERLAQLYRDKGDQKALVALLEKLVKSLTPLLTRSPRGARAADGDARGARPPVERAALRSPRARGRELARLAELDPQNAYAIYAAREMLKAQQQFAEAIPFFAMEQAIVDDPERKLALFRDEAETRKRVGDLAGATQALRGARAARGRRRAQAGARRAHPRAHRRRRSRARGRARRGGAALRVPRRGLRRRVRPLLLGVGAQGRRLATIARCSSPTTTARSSTAPPSSRRATRPTCRRTRRGSWRRGARQGGERHASAARPRCPTCRAARPRRAPRAPRSTPPSAPASRPRSSRHRASRPPSARPRRASARSPLASRPRSRPARAAPLRVPSFSAPVAPATAAAFQAPSQAPPPSGGAGTTPVAPPVAPGGAPSPVAAPSPGCVDRVAPHRRLAGQPPAAPRRGPGRVAEGPQAAGAHEVPRGAQARSRQLRGALVGGGSPPPEAHVRRPARRPPRCVARASVSPETKQGSSSATSRACASRSSATRDGDQRLQAGLPDRSRRRAGARAAPPPAGEARARWDDLATSSSRRRWARRTSSRRSRSKRSSPRSTSRSARTPPPPPRRGRASPTSPPRTRRRSRRRSSSSRRPSASISPRR
jgi:hypothetical protein